MPKERSCHTEISSELPSGLNRRKFLSLSGSGISLAAAGCVGNDSSPTTGTPENTVVGQTDTQEHSVEQTGEGQTETSSPTDSASTSADTENWTQYLYDAANTGFTPNRTGPKEKPSQVWKAGTISELHKRVHPVVLDGTVFLGDKSGLVYAFNLADGERLWLGDDDFSPFQSTPAIANGTLLMSTSTGARLLALNPKDGSIKWDFEFPGSHGPTGAPTVMDESIYGLTSNGLYSINLENGSEQWSTDIIEGGFGSPAVAREAVYVGGETKDQKNVIMAIDRESGDKRWSITSGIGLIEATPAVKNDMVYIGTSSGSKGQKFYALNADDGTKEWAIETEDPVTWSAAVDNETVVFGGRTHLFGYDATDGSKKWGYTAQAFGPKAPIIADDTVYVDGGGGLHALDIETGENLWTLEGPIGGFAPPAVVDGVLVTADLDGNVYAFE